MAEGTGVVDYNSQLERTKWMREGLIQAAPKSFWAAYTGSSSDSIVYQMNDPTAGEGQNVVFDFDGELVEGPVKGKETAFGKGEQKRKFSDRCTVERFRFTVDNGDKFDAVNIGDLSITEHSDSRTKLGNKWIKFKDQSIFDVSQHSATHIIRSATWDFDYLMDIENILKTGTGYSVGARRAPIKPFMTADGKPVWLVVVDSTLKTKMLKSSGAQNLLKDTDIRGNSNRLFTSTIGKIGHFVFVEADNFFGSTLGAAGSGILDSDGYALMNNNTEIQFAGLRQYKDNGTDYTPALWSGEAGFTASTETLHSRALILGAGAFQYGFGKMPDYNLQMSQDFGIKSESMMEIWCGVKAAKYTVENTDYSTPIGGISNGLIALDIKL